MQETVGGRALNLQAENAVAVTVSDTTLLNAGTLYVGIAGNVNVDTVGGQTSVVFQGVPAGGILPVQVIRVRATSTTASACVLMS
jgi:hypothetical protein